MADLTDDERRAILLAATLLTGPKRRRFLAEIAHTYSYCGGSAHLAETTFVWGGEAVHTGLNELRSGIHCVEAFEGLGRKTTEELHPELEGHIRRLVGPHAQTDPKFQTPFAYTRITARAVRKALPAVPELAGTVPSRQTVGDILNRLGYAASGAQDAVAKKVSQIRNTRTNPNAGSHTTVPSAAIDWSLIRTTVAAIEDAERFGQRLRTEADRLGVTTAAAATVLGDGAEWIWNLAADHLPQAGGVLDVFHAIEHIGDAVKAVWGNDADATAGRIDAGRTALLAGGKPGLERWLAGAFTEVPAAGTTDPLIDLAAYLAKHPTRLNYAERLAAGRSIGSGAVEGAIKQQVNLRMKRTGARWRVEHVGPLVELRVVAPRAAHP